MKKRLLFILCLFSLSSGAALAQTKTVTNQDLEKFRQKRLQAEQDYRENYAKLGFPSPEELDRQHEQERKDRAELAGRIRQENLEREKIQSENEFRREQINVLRNGFASQSYAQSDYNRGNNSGVYFGSYPIYGYPGFVYPNGYFRNSYGTRGFGRRAGIVYGSPGFLRRPGIDINGGVRIHVRVGSGGGRGGRRY